MSYRHEPGCQGTANIPHWHHACWQCGADLCGYLQGDYYRCGDCLVEERVKYPPEPVHRDFDPELALRISSPA